MALAKGASMAGTGDVLGRGRMIPPERDLSIKWYYQNIQSRYGFNPHHLMLADACEFFIGQGCKVGLGGHLMGQKVTEQVAEMRSLPPGIDQRSPARHPDWLGPDDLSLKVQEVREATDYRIPIQLEARRGARVRRRADGGQVRAGHDLPRRRRGLHGRGAAHRDRGDRHPADGRDPRGPAGARGRRPGRRHRPDRRRRDPQRRRRRQVPRARRQGGRDRHHGADGAELQQGDPRRHRLRGHGRRPGRPVLPLPHRSLPRRHHDAGPELRKRLEVDEAAERVYNLLHGDDDGAADARPRLRQDRRALARARGPVRAHGRGRGDGQGPARRHQLHPGRDRGGHARRAQDDDAEVPGRHRPVRGRRERDERPAPDDQGHARRRGARRPPVPVPGGPCRWSRTSTWTRSRRARTSTGSRTSTCSRRTASPPCSTATRTRS